MDAGEKWQYFRRYVVAKPHRSCRTPTLKKKIKKIRICFSKATLGFRTRVKSSVLLLFAVVNPSTGKTLGSVADMNDGDTEVAIQTARDAFQSWKKTTAKVRVRVRVRSADDQNPHKEMHKFANEFLPSGTCCYCTAEKSFHCWYFSTAHSCCTSGTA